MFKMLRNFIRHQYLSEKRSLNILIYVRIVTNLNKNKCDFSLSAKVKFIKYPKQR